MHQQDIINEEDKMIRKKYTVNNQKQCWGFHHITVEHQVFWVVAP
jgi:hypothetical protein